ncbi:ATP-binding protein [Kineosporia rhizophila]|uniref:ATP-binding response regulator n=1 Tax=Kineosporia TaxID=49184 RepID=UPI001E4A6E8E|nr:MULTISPECIES: ATP-binding protein [Kineosporia]MCE0535059.1 ATP-binding protein [Kineosporia rhizophila]GLY14657.1 PAS domain-containing sensor histidine kinase [Kineosporia sp. NBRC 101677]
MPSPLRLLIVEDRPDDAELLLLELKRAGYEPTWTRVETPEEFVSGLGEQPDIVLCDYSLPSMAAPDALRMLRELQMDIPLIVVSGVMDEDTCVNSLRLGASDYLLKDRLVRLAPAIEHALAKRRLATQARVIEQERRETAEILRGVVDHAPAAICVRDATGRTLLTNTEFDRLRPTAAAPRPAVLDRRKLTSVEQACLDGADKVEGEEIWSVDGEDRTFLVVRYPVVDGTGRRFAIGAIYVDITRQKQVEEELRELDRLKGEFVATVSHELRTPLTSITGYAEMLLASAEDPTHTRMVQVIDRNSRRLLALVEDLLTLSRVDSGAAARMDEEVDVAELVATSVGVLGPAMESQGVEIDVQIPPGLPYLIGNRSQLERVLLNLLSNAVKFSTAGGTVTVAASVPDLTRPGVQISVSDTGIGIPVEEQGQLFTRFFRTEQARRQAIQGTGLGLAVVRQIVEAHHGTIGVKSAADEGATFTVNLPAMTSLPVPLRL